MNLPPALPIYFIFWLWVAGVWIFRTYRLLVTLRKTPRVSPAPGQSPEDFVSILIPAKNEEANIRACLESLRNQDYPSFEIIVINDNSSDRTESILKSMNQTTLHCPPAPDGWTGKNHAIHCGVAHAKGDWLLFTDADTRHEPQGLSAAMSHSQKHKLEFLTLLPHCLTGSFIENLIQPLAMAFLGLWFPLEKVNDPESPLYFANGQYLLMKRSLYEKIGGHKAVRHEFLEDFALMKEAKALGAKAQCAFGAEIYGTRMYDSLGTIWKGWRRIYLHAFKRDVSSLLKNAAMIFVFSFLPFVLFIPSVLSSSNPIPIFAGMIILMILVITWRAYAMVRAKGIYAVFHPLAGLMMALILLDAARMALTNQRTQWR